MEFVYTFGEPRTLYLNVTNRCTNRCSFCVGRCTDGLGGALLRGGPEPDLDELLEAIWSQGDPGELEEVVWCGFGEPTFRLDLISGAAPALRKAGVPVIRLNTNGHASLIHHRPAREVLAELGQAVDVISISLNAPSAHRYVELCAPRPSSLATIVSPERFFEATVELLGEAPSFIQEVRASVVSHALEAEEVRATRSLALELGLSDLHLR